MSHPCKAPPQTYSPASPEAVHLHEEPEDARYIMLPLYRMLPTEGWLRERGLLILPCGRKRAADNGEELQIASHKDAVFTGFGEPVLAQRSSP